MIVIVFVAIVVAVLFALYGVSQSGDRLVTYSDNETIRGIQQEFETEARKIHESQEQEQESEKHRQEAAKELLIRTLNTLNVKIVNGIDENHSEEIPMFGIIEVIPRELSALDIVRNKIAQAIREDNRNYLDNLLYRLYLLSELVSKFSGISLENGNRVEAEQFAILANVVKVLTFDIVSNYDSSPHAGLWIDPSTGEDTPRRMYEKIEALSNKAEGNARELNPLFVI